MKVIDNLEVEPERELAYGDVVQFEKGAALLVQSWDSQYGVCVVKLDNFGIVNRYSNLSDLNKNGRCGFMGKIERVLDKAELLLGGRDS